MIIGMEKQLEQTICRAGNIQPENALVLKASSLIFHSPTVI